MFGLEFNWFSFLLAKSALWGVAFAISVICILYLLRRLYKAETKNKFFERGFNNPSHGLIFFDEGGEINFFNDMSKKLLDLSSKDLETYNVQDFFNFIFDHAVDCDESLKKTIEKSTMNFSKSGEAFREVIAFEDDVFYLVIAQKNHLEQTVIVLIDISQRKKYEEDLSYLGQINYQLENAINATPVGIVISMPSEEGNPIGFVNSAFYNLIGFEKSASLELSWQKICSVFEEKNLDEEITLAFHSQNSQKITLTRMYEGRKRWFVFFINPVFAENNSVNLYIGVLQETTDLKRKEEEFFQAQKLESLGKLSAGVAHDFNNILSIINGYAQLASRGIDKDASSDLQQHLERILTSVERGSALTQRMLTFSRHKLNKEEIIDVGRILSEQKDLLEAIINPNINMILDIKQNDVFVETSADSIAQILINLVVNARDSIADRNGEIILRLEHKSHDRLSEELQDEVKCAKGCVCLSVLDNGAGMDKQTQQKLFDPFFTTKEEGQGTGLGMSVVYGLVQNMQGEIFVESQKGIGTTVMIMLPLSSQKPSKEIGSALNESGAAGLNGYTALVVDDEPDLLSITSDFLKDAGMNVLKANNGNEALLLQDEYNGEIDILITDILMPELDGIKLAELMVSLRQDTKVLFVSGYPAMGNKDHTLDIPKDSYFLPKPFDGNNMVKMVLSIIQGEEVKTMQDYIDSKH